MPPELFCALSGVGQQRRRVERDFTSYRFTDQRVAEVKTAIENSNVAREFSVLGTAGAMSYSGEFNRFRSWGKFKFSPKSISLSDGTLASADFDDVPFVRFRKQMSMRGTLLTPDDYVNGRDSAYAKENTVFVVRADALLAFLEQFEVPKDSARRFA